MGPHIKANLDQMSPPQKGVTRTNRFKTTTKGYPSYPEGGKEVHLGGTLVGSGEERQETFDQSCR